MTPASPRRKRKRNEIPGFIVLAFAVLLIGLLFAGYALHQVEHESNIPNSGGLFTSILASSGPATSGERLSQVMNRQATDAAAAYSEARYNSPLFERPKPAPEKPPKEPFYHIVFSTSCQPQMDWESYVLFYHAYKVKQAGNITRLVAGCDAEGEETLRAFHSEHIRTLSENFFLHFTPDYGDVSELEMAHKDHNFNTKFKYMNKPFSFLHWLEHEMGFSKGDDDTLLSNPKYDDDIIFLVDPDMMLMKPLVHDFSESPNIVWVDMPPDPFHQKVRHGHPFAQQDGYLTSNWVDLDLKKITQDEDTVASHVSKETGIKQYNSGPPYIMTGRDAYAIAQKWTAYAPRVLSLDPVLFSEMHALIIATAHLNMPLNLIQSLVVSTTIVRGREGWSLVDKMDSVCPHDFGASESMPYILHYCKRYLLGDKTFFSKYRYRKDILSCEAPLLEEPSPEIQELRSWTAPPPTLSIQKQRSVVEIETGNVTAQIAQREAFMLCGLIPRMNQALEHWKRNACVGQANYSKVYSIYNDPGEK